MGLFTYVVRRLVLAIFVLIGVTFITFVLAHSLGGNPIQAWLGRTASDHPQLVKLFTQEYHLNDPLWVQYYYYIVNLLRGNWGFSPSRGFVPVITVIEQTLPFTLQIVIIAFILSVIFAIGFGVLSARYHHTIVDRSIRAFYIGGISLPSYFLGLLILIIFTLFFHLLPTGGAYNPNLNPPRIITGLPLFDSLLEGNWAYFSSSLKHVILPSLTLALVTFGFVLRVLRSSLLDVMNLNYIRTARAKGLGEGTVFFKHGLRNALIPVITLTSLMITWMITGSIFVENIFAYPGIGQYVVQALLQQDYPGILATTLIFALIIVSSNLVADILYASVDPQMRLE